MHDIGVCKCHYSIVPVRARTSVLGSAGARAWPQTAFQLGLVESLADENYLCPIGGGGRHGGDGSGGGGGDDSGDGSDGGVDDIIDTVIVSRLVGEICESVE